MTRRRLARVGVIVVAVVAIVAGVNFLTRTFTATGSNREAQVLRVIDGDTIVVELDGAQQRVRLIGIDAPETTKGKHDCFGLEATNALDVLVGHRTVRLLSDPTQTDTDRYDRLLRYVHVDGDVDAGLMLLRNGWVREYTYRASDPYLMQADYRTAQDDARDGSDGGWSACGWSE